MFEEAAPDSGLLMCLPHIQELAHTPGDILPALDIPGAAFLVEPEGLLRERGVVAPLAQMNPTG